MWRQMSVLGLTTALLGLAACGDDNGPGASAFDRGGSLGRLLATLPAGTADQDGALVLLADLDTARQQLGIEVPAADASGDEFTEYALALTGASEEQGGLPWSEGLSQRQMIPARAAYEEQFGISFTDVDGFAEVDAPPRLVTVATGDFDRDRIEEAVESDPTWSDDLERAEHGGTDYWSWLEDEEMDLARRDDVHPLGESTRLALVDDRLARTRATADMEATLDALAGDASLADDGVLASLTDGLDGAGAVAGMLITEVGRFTVEGLAGGLVTPEALEELERETLTLAPYRGLAVGVDFGEGGVDEPFMVVVLDHADAEAAEDNVERFERIVTEGLSVQSRQPWSERFEIDSIEADGTRMVARLGIEIPALWLGVISQPDSLLVHD